MIRTIIPKKFSHCCKSSRLHNKFPNLGIQQRNCIPPGNLTLKVSRIWLQNFHRTGETESWREQQNLLCTRTQEIGGVTPQETEPDLPESVQKSPVEMWVDSGLPRGQYHWLQQSEGADLSPFTESHHYPYHSLTSGQTTGKEYSPTHQQKIGSKSYWAWPCSPKQDPVFTTASTSHQEASTGFSFSSIRGQTEWKPQSQKTNQTDPMDHSLVSLSEWRKWSEVTQLCLALCDPVDCSLPGASVHAISIPSKSTGVDCHSLLQEIFPTQGLNLGFPHCRQTLYRLSHREVSESRLGGKWVSHLDILEGRISEATTAKLQKPRSVISLVCLRNSKQCDWSRPT